VRYLIWSNQHGAWWKTNGFGYTLDIGEAGRFSREQAEEDVESAGSYGPIEGLPDEVMVLAPEHRWQGGPPMPPTEDEVRARVVAEIAAHRDKFYPDDGHIDTAVARVRRHLNIAIQLASPKPTLTEVEQMWKAAVRGGDRWGP
jgi:hypothetical protein